jgi:hypothetical protein
MRTWKHWYFTAIFLLIGGVFYINALDLIILKDGNMIEAKIVEISPSEIRYKRINNLDGPTVIVPAVNVLSIRYENGTYEIINAGVTPQQEIKKFIFGINANAGGLIGNALGGGYGAGINIELGKGKFNSEINLMFPTGGFGALVTFNGYWPGQIGGFYLGGGIGYSFFDTFNRYNDIASSLPVGLNIGYKFITKSGLYFRTGAFAGLDICGIWDEYVSPFYFKPDLAIGWTMR